MSIAVHQNSTALTLAIAYKTNPQETTATQQRHTINIKSRPGVYATAYFLPSTIHTLCPINGHLPHAAQAPDQLGTATAQLHSSCSGNFRTSTSSHAKGVCCCPLAAASTHPLLVNGSSCPAAASAGDRSCTVAQLLQLLPYITPASFPSLHTNKNTVTQAQLKQGTPPEQECIMEAVMLSGAQCGQ
jgi:hypothetical protein